MPSFLIQTLGCKLNQLESEAITDAFLKLGIRNEESGIEERTGEKIIENSEREPSVIVINTCTVTSKADQKARRVIRKALRDYPFAAVIVTGCYAQLNKDDILKLEAGKKGRLYVAEKDKIINFIKTLMPDSSFSIPDSSPCDMSFQFNPRQFLKHTRAFLKIQDGCDMHCTYCRIRLARGKSISLDAGEVLSRLHALEQTHAEAVLTGVNISQYREQLTDNNEQRKAGNSAAERHERTQTEEREKILNLAGLLEFLLNGTNKTAIRLSSLAPESMDDDLCKVLSHPRIRPHFHLSVQSLSDNILQKMGRPYNCETVKKAVLFLRGARDDPFIACDIITGFPGETEAEFQKTFNLCKELDFAWIHVFPYSKRPGTPAFSFSGAVHESDVTKRVQLLTDLARQGRCRYVRRQLGKEIDVLIENGNPGTCRGVSENYLKVLVMNDGENAPAAGTVLRCKLVKEGNFDEYDGIVNILTAKKT